MVSRTLMALIAATLAATVLFPSAALAALLDDDHSVEQIVKAIQTPLTKEELAQAQQWDDQLMAGGDFMGAKGYLVTDPRVTGITEGVMGRLLGAMGEDSSKWVVRVVDTRPPVVNAFVTGGKYVYILFPLLSQVSSEDELAFIMAHELGHSYLHHMSRQEDSDTQALATLADLISMAAGGEERLARTQRVTGALRGAFSQASEREADTFAAALSARAGYSPVRGTDFFSRQAWVADQNLEAALASLQAEKAQVEQAMANCQQYTQAFQAYRTQQAQANMQAVCADAESRRLAYNARVEEYEQVSAAVRGSIYASHPANQDRVAFIAAVSDCLAGKREIDSLKKTYEQAHRTLTALKKVDSPILREPPAVQAAPAPPSAPVLLGAEPAAGAPEPDDLAARLRKLKSLFDEGLITQEEYDRKKAELLEKL